MDKIIYTCSAEYIGYTFPKRKWWNIFKKPRICQFVITDVGEKENIDIIVQILETPEWEQAEGSMSPCTYRVQIAEPYREEIEHWFAGEILQEDVSEVLLLIDPTGEEFTDILIDFAEDKNYLAIFTEHPQKYEMILERLEEETGLIGMAFTEYRDFVHYQKVICRGKPAVVFIGKGILQQQQNGKMYFYRFPKKSIVLDFSEEEFYHKMFRGKRMEADYVSMPVFLDNIVKSGYNSLVNEGVLNYKGKKLITVKNNVSR